MSPTTTRQKVGLGLAMAMSLTSIPSMLTPTPDGEEGPPYVILVLGSILGVVGLVAAMVAWRNGSSSAIRIVAGTLIIAALTSLPAFFVDVPAALKALVAAGVIATVTAIVLIFSSSQPPVTVTD